MEEDDDNEKNSNFTTLSNPSTSQCTLGQTLAHTGSSAYTKLANFESSTFVSFDSNEEDDRLSFEQGYEYGNPEDAELLPALGSAHAMDKSEEETKEDEDHSISQITLSETSSGEKSEDSNVETTDIDYLRRFRRDTEPATLSSIPNDIHMLLPMDEEQDMSLLSPADSDASSIEDSTTTGHGRRGSSRGQYRGRNRGRIKSHRPAATTAAKHGGRGIKRGWRMVLERMESQDVSETQRCGYRRGRGRPPGTSSIGKGVQRGRKRGTRVIAEPSREFKKLQSEATQAFLIDGEMEKALVIARKAVQINPEIYAAHSLLSEILWTIGRKEDSVGALFSGAHTRRDPKIWWNVADRTMELAINAAEKGAREAFVVQVIYCLTMVLKLDNEDYDARMERMRLQVELGNIPRARRDCEKLLEKHPYDAVLLRQLAELCITNEEVARAKKFYDDFIEIAMAGKMKEEDGFTWSFINIYLDLLDRLALWNEATQKLRQFSRCLLKRAEEAYWDTVIDDREWDIEDNPRRSEVIDFEPGRFDLATYGLGLPLELRIKLGLFRLKAGVQHHNEALGHFNFLDPENAENPMVLDYDDLFRDVADALRQHDHYGPALRFYSALRRNPQISKSAYFPSMALCFRSLGYLDELEKCYKELIEENSKNYEALVQLAMLYQEQARNEDYLMVVAQLQIAGKRKLLNLDPPSSGGRDTAVTEEVDYARENRKSDRSKNLHEYHGNFVQLSENQLSTSQRLEKAKMNDQAARATYQRLLSLKQATTNDDADATGQWIIAAAYLLQDLDNYGHRDTQLLRRAERARQEKLGITETLAQDLSLVEDASFREISFDQWLNIVCEYAYLLAQRGDNNGCWRAIMKACEFSPFYQDRARSHEIYLCMVVCAVKLGDEDQLQNAARWFVKTYGYSANVYSFYTIAHHAYNGIRPRIAYNSGPSQKFMLRQLKSIDWAVMPPETREASYFADLEKKLYTRREEEHVASGEPLPETHLPSALSAYAHMLASGGSYATALSYYHRAYTITPDDPILNLSIAIAFAQHALKRQSENRLVQIQIGASFLKRYKALRNNLNVSHSAENGDVSVTYTDVIDSKDVSGSAKLRSSLIKQETEFNEGRFWHMLGLMHLAIPAYERCLEAGRSREIKDNSEYIMYDEQEKLNLEDSNINNKSMRAQRYHQAREADDRSVVSQHSSGYAEEAAFALQLIFIMVDDVHSAREITEEWLVI